MRNFKIIVGFFLIGISIYTFLEMYPNEYGAGLWGVATGTVIIILIGAALIYSTQHKIIKEEKRKEAEYKKERSIINEISEKEENLINLRDKDILSEEEFKSKMSKIHQDRTKTELKKTKEYLQLQQLYRSKILTGEEFDSKVDLLLKKQNIEPLEIGLKNKLINTGYHQIRDFKEGRARIWDENQLFGFIDENYHIIVEPKFTLAEDFSEGLALVYLYDNYGFINKKGEIVIHLQYEYAESFKEGIANVKLDNEQFYIDRTGKEVIKKY